MIRLIIKVCHTILKRALPPNQSQTNRPTWIFFEAYGAALIAVRAVSTVVLLLAAAVVVIIVLAAAAFVLVELLVAAFNDFVELAAVEPDAATLASALILNKNEPMRFIVRYLFPL